MPEKARPTGKFRLILPLDASEIEGFKPEQDLKVLALSADGAIASEIVKLDQKGQGRASFAFAEQPEGLQLFVGPTDASDEELLGMQTLELSVPTLPLPEPELILPPLRIPPFYWFWWLRWCRTFTIRGRVLCPDGSPVPGAQVCAYDVDKFWWWCSEQLVGCATTDASGTFEITFRWCCGWRPWWWWRQRFWRLEPSLVDLILPALQELDLPRPPQPDPAPTLAVFESLMAEGGIPARPRALDFDLSALEGLREPLKARLPLRPEFERLHLWPWWPWRPWWDCTPDINFRVTQRCRGEEHVIVDEGCSDTRWDIPTNLSVTLIANDLACCIDEPPPPRGRCMVISPVCSDQLNNIGGNPGAPAGPLGYANPGWVAPFGDRPYAGTIPIGGQFGTTAAVDYYEFEWSPNPGGPWNPMPPAASGGFYRTYWGPQLGGGPVDFHSVYFPAAMISGRNVYESREHFQANNDPGSWGLTRFWTGNRDLLTRWETQNNFADGTYYLQVRSWTRAGYAGNLSNSRVLPLCNTEQDNRLVLTIDNQVLVPPAAHPHPCGPGTVHVCTREPDTAIDAVLINGLPAEACATINASEGGTLDIFFTAHDPDGHLAYYTLQATYGNNLVVNLLAAPGAALSPAPALNGVPPALQVGPTYGEALTLPQTAIAPTWAGGRLRLHLPDLKAAFRETCCYQLELRAYKRTIVSCHYGAAHYNLSEYSITVIL